MGLATAELLASRGATISLADLNEAALRKAVELLTAEKEHLATVVDVRESSSVNSWIEKTVQKYGKLDGAVNMAGVLGPSTPIRDLGDEEMNFVMSVNLIGVFNCIRAQLMAMKSGASIVSRLRI